ncbi:Predicted transcriptional regulator [Paenibacillus sp. UNCCL117]|uniref:ArsR/SmtB family transcription factor n=1 Tax=unclassified Paenibacillus TaxID=185978 RepID=UPI000880CB19|nr:MULTISPECIES: ArsR family transcriptional regulator [unclassified Paenibacillus]SDC91720.1 Predicted transcriptional regulator [Paenibacillus sp. cl123]SFW29149.1 Predicted transcriptional regulator [Paenibacillus sp. UNCCL117]
MLHIKDLRSGLSVFKALGSDIRIEIVELLAKHQSLNLNDLAALLKLTNGAVTMHIKKLEDSGLIRIATAVGKHGVQKICCLNEDKLIVDLRSREAGKLYEVELKVGHYSHYQAAPTCGLATKDRIIGEFDDPRYFADPQRIDAQILWLTEGFLEYRIPNYIKPNQSFQELQFSMELGSEAPGFCDNYPSDIYFLVNGIELGYWTSPGDFGDIRGTFNPEWWPPNLNQYGLLKLIRINRDGSYIDGSRISDVSLKDLNLDHRSDITLRIEVGERSRNKRGFTLYGRSFGNYSQDILARVLYADHDSP